MLRQAHLPAQGAQQAYLKARFSAAAVSGNFGKSCSIVLVLFKKLLCFDFVVEFQGCLGGFSHGCATFIGHWIATTVYSYLEAFYSTGQAKFRPTNAN